MQSSPIIIAGRSSNDPPAPIALTQAGSLLQAITAAASNPAVDIDKMQRLFDMHSKMVAQEAEAAFNAALSRAQGRIAPIEARAWNTHTKSWYAKLADINKEVMPIYAEEGLAISFNSGDAPEGLLRTIAVVSHKMGHSRQYHYDLPLDDKGSAGNVNKTPVHATSSTRMYARRYLVCMIFNVSTEHDDDGNAAGGKKAGPAPDAEGKKALEACGSESTLKAAWQALTKEQRETLGDVMTECRRAIREADAQ